MLNYFAKKIFGSSNDRVLKQFYPIVGKINELEKIYSKLSDEQILNKTNEDFYFFLVQEEIYFS